MAAHKQPSYAASALRALTYRLAATPTVQLPRHVSALASSIWNCQDILTTPADSLKNDSELSVIVHRFKTQLTTLLGDRTIEGRWAAVVLVKTAIEAGSVEVLSKSNGWVRSLLVILKKPDPATTRILTVLTLTRIFMLTWDYSNLIREITTPALPTFVLACLSNAENARCTADELQAVLESFKVLIPHHPTIFRTNESALTAFLLKIIGSCAQPDGSCFTSEHVAIAQEIIALLSLCVPKQGGAAKWEEELSQTVKAAHETASIIFTPIIETWKSSVELHDLTTPRKGTSIEQPSTDAFRLAPWKGVYAGAERLTTLLDQIKAHIDNASPHVVNIRLGLIIDLLSRITAVTVPGLNKLTSVQFNPQVSKEEREALFAVLPRVHEHVLQLLDTMLQRLDAITVSAVPTVLEMLIAVFAAESYDTQLRASAYALLKTVLASIGPSLSKDEVSDLAVIANACSQDCESHRLSKKTDDAPGKKQADLVLAMAKTDASNPVCLDDLHYQATTLLPLLLLQIDPSKMSRRVRTQLDRTAILTRNKHSLLASVLNPAPSSSGHGLQSSLLPFIARLFPNDPEVEALIRPRMPFIGAESQSADVDEDEDAEQDDAGFEDEAMQDVAAAEDSESSDDEDIPLPTANGKHTLVPDSESDAKRPRIVSTASSQIRSEWQTALESTVVVNEQPTTRPIVERASTVATSQPDPVSLGNEAEDDGSDFEMPPLTMDSDSVDDEDD